MDPSLSSKSSPLTIMLPDIFPLSLYLYPRTASPPPTTARLVTRRRRRVDGAVIVLASRVFTSVLRLTQEEVQRLIGFLWFQRVVRSPVTPFPSPQDGNISEA